MIEHERSIKDQRLDYHRRLRESQMREGFSYDDDAKFVTRPYWPLEPKNRMQPHLWPWEEVKKLVKEAGVMVGLGRGSRKYDRRVLALTNPGAGDEFTLSGPLFGDIQLIQPGESAPCHRHTPSAARFILEGQGGWTTVAGERVSVKPGDVIFTGQFPWHDHGNEGPDDFIFLDILDIPLLLFTATSAWEFNCETVTGSRDVLNQPAEVTNFPNAHYLQRELEPRFEASWQRQPKDFAHLKWSEAKKSLDRLRHEKGSYYDGILLEFTSTAGGPIGPTMSIFTQLLRKNEKTLQHRHTSSTIYVVTEGTGRVNVEDHSWVFKKGDIFVIPSWHWHSFEASNEGDAYLHSISEASLIAKMNLWREQQKRHDGRIIDSGWGSKPYSLSGISSC
jgi:gentisate 1,2-dioxygenase